MYTDSDTVHACLSALAGALGRRGLKYELVVLGGASLLARDLTARATVDVDVLGLRLPDGTVRSAWTFPPALQDAIREVAAAFDLPEVWLDDRPGSDFENAAPTGFDRRLEPVGYGESLTVWHLARFDIVAIKVVAAAERWGEPDNKHWHDVRTLAPSTAELEHARSFALKIWAPSSAAWGSLDALEAELGDGRQ